MNSFDAIVIGSGITGGWAAKELTEKGLNVVMLERGRDIKHVSGYETANTPPWQFKHRAKMTLDVQQDYATLVRMGYGQESNRHLFESDKDHPYIEKKPFDWLKGYHTGGKSLMWGRHSYRWNKDDFEANGREGIGVDWPIRYEDLAPWYSYVERFVGISGMKEGLDVLPDGEFLKPFPMFAPELYLRAQVKSKFKRTVTIGRSANLTDPQPWHSETGRASCQNRNLCLRGCPFGGYFSTQSATLPAAMKTKRLTLVNNAIVSEIIFDEKKNRATGVRVIDAETNKVTEYYAKIIFVNAGTIPTASVLLRSKSSRFPNGLGNDSDQVGRNLMDHNGGPLVTAKIDGFEDDYYYGRRPTTLYVPRYRNWGSDKQPYLRGFGYQGAASRTTWTRGLHEKGFGAEFKDELTKPGPWSIFFVGIGEMLPNPNNRMYLDSDKKDKWGLPLVVFDVEFGENEKMMRQPMGDDMVEMLTAAGFKDVRAMSIPMNPGFGIHEMGTARMGKDPKTSVLNQYNQIHACKNVFVTDGAAMASSSCVNPSLTYMALTARAADFAVGELKKQNL
ncbi:GMC family oxidoreductase [Chitinophagaceae bacterium LB-8]|uniref:GMC family oxidoreductase n=1 Tax=Paraflavisolibacter caeni TaxID=2982496 RepID=A0A9X2XWG3_9BACT|nr:GMC family oxidoreductase [Paraflavisolibacter caeni]MCU7549767.1 GMC family oxidoreductase [Paraflavisolibacter caeni]